MSIFKGQKFNLSEITSSVADYIFKESSANTKVDYYTKALYGRVMFYLLLYAILSDSKLGQRGLADLYSSPIFRLLFNLTLEKRKISHSSISERLSVIEVDYFKNLYEYVLKKYSIKYPAQKLSGLKLERVDSTLVVDVANKLSEGLSCGNEHKKGKMLKFTMNYDGMYGNFTKTHNEEKYASECLALPENIIEHFKKNKEHSSVYVFDRGLSSAKSFEAMKSNKNLLFVGRLLENRKLKIVKEFDLTFKKFDNAILKSDAIVKLYKKEKTTNKNGKQVETNVETETTFRVIRFCPKDKTEDIVLITNILFLRAEMIAQMYRRRWDIEVFFRFLKQELNFSHFISVNENGIQVILYMTLITAMLIMIYKTENNVGFKTAKRRMLIELEAELIDMVVLLIGGDKKRLDKYYSRSP